MESKGKDLYSDSDHKLIKLDENTLGIIFGKDNTKDKFINKAALYSVTINSHAHEICRIIKYVNKNIFSILDSTVCVGGNTTEFLKTFVKVMGTELDNKNYLIAKLNLKGKIKDEDLINKSCIDFLKENKYEFDCIFFDPPWNLKGHKEISHDSIGIPGMSLKDTVYFLLQYTDFLVLKTHKSDDILYYEKYLKKTQYKIVCLNISNYKIILITKDNEKYNLDFSNFKFTQLKSFNYKSILDKIK